MIKCAEEICTIRSPHVRRQMHWSLAIDNYQALKLLHADAETLSRIDLHELVLRRDGPVLRLRFDVSAVPASLPHGWPPGSNATQITLAAIGAEGLQVSGWGTRMQGRLSVESELSERCIVFTGPSATIKAGFAVLRVEAISGYINHADGQPAA